MSNYIRRYVPGGSYFFTVRLQNKSSDLLTQRIDLLRSATRLCMKRWPFIIDDAVVLPNRLHMIWTLPEGDSDYSKRWRLIKSTFSRHVPPSAFTAPSQQKRGEKGIWQRRFWEHVIRDDADYALHAHLIATAPVSAGLVTRMSDWPYSSYQARKVGLNPPYVKTTGPVRSGPDQAAALTATQTVQNYAKESC